MEFSLNHFLQKSSISQKIFVTGTSIFVSLQNFDSFLQGKTPDTGLIVNINNWLLIFLRRDEVINVDKWPWFMYWIRSSRNW